MLQPQRGALQVLGVRGSEAGRVWKSEIWTAGHVGHSSMRQRYVCVCLPCVRACVRVRSCICLRVYVCVKERERMCERTCVREGKREGDLVCACVFCVCLCVCVRACVRTRLRTAKHVP